jgi:hypothetical protein
MSPFSTNLTLKFSFVYFLFIIFYLRSFLGRFFFFHEFSRFFFNFIFYLDYDASNYDDYFDVRREKIDSGLINAPKTTDPHEKARAEFDAIDWSWIENPSKDYDTESYQMWY